MFKRLFSSGTKEQCAMVALMCWSIWNRRNKWAWNKIEVSVFGIKKCCVELTSRLECGTGEHQKSNSGKLEL